MANKRVREACVCVQPEVAGVGLAGVRICAGRFGVTSTSQKSRAREREGEGGTGIIMSSEVAGIPTWTHSKAWARVRDGVA